MHTLKRIGVFLFVFGIAFMAGIYSEKFMNSFYPHRYENEINPISVSKPDNSEENIKPAIQSEELITADTKLIIIEHNLESGEEIKGENVMPTKYIGLNRERFIEEMEIYEISPALSDIKKGFRSLAVVSFSSKEIQLQKNYSNSAIKMRFYMVSKDNKLVVYYEDMETVFLTTDISMENLPENVRLEILNKKYFESEEELYNFLESYSS